MMQQSKSQKETIWNKDFILLLMVNALTFISMHMLSTTIAKYVISLNDTAAMAGFIAGVFSVSSIIARPICGNLIDRKSKKSMYIFAMGTIVLGMVGYSFSHQAFMLIIFRLIHGIGWGFATTIGMTMASNTAPEGKIGECVSVYGLANVLAMAIAPNLGAYISTQFGFGWMFITAAAIAALALGSLVLIREQPAPEQPTPLKTDVHKFSLDSLVLKEALILAVVLILSSMAYTAVPTFLMIYSESVGIANPGIFFTVYSVTILVVRLLSGKIVDRKGPEYIIVPGGFFFVAALLLLGNLQNEIILSLAAVCLGVGFSATLSTLMAVAFKRTGKNRRGVASSTITIGMDLGAGLGSTAAGLLSGLFGYGAMYILLCIPVVLSVLLFVTDQRMYRFRRGFYKRIPLDAIPLDAIQGDVN